MPPHLKRVTALPCETVWLTVANGPVFCAAL